MASARLSTILLNVSFLIALNFSVLPAHAQYSNGSGTAEINLDAHLVGRKAFYGTGISTNEVCWILKGQNDPQLWWESITQT